MSEIFKCHFCGMVFTNISYFSKHSKVCYSNPARRACKTCGNLDFDESGVYCHQKNEIDFKVVFGCVLWVEKIDKGV